MVAVVPVSSSGSKRHAQSCCCFHSSIGSCARGSPGSATMGIFHSCSARIFLWSSWASGKVREGGETSLHCSCASTYGTSVISFLPALEGLVPWNDHIFPMGGQVVAVPTVCPSTCRWQAALHCSPWLALLRRLPGFSFWSLLHTSLHLHRTKAVRNDYFSLTYGVFPHSNM